MKENRNNSRKLLKNLPVQNLEDSKNFDVTNIKWY